MWWGEVLNKLLRTTDNLNAESKCDSSYTIRKIQSIQIKIKCEKSYQEENKLFPYIISRKPKEDLKPKAIIDKN